MPDRLDPVFVRAQIEAMRLAYPDIWDDEDDRLLALESETELHEFLAGAVDRMQDAQAMAEGIDGLFKLWKSRLTRYEQRVEAIRALMFKLMMAAELRKLELPAATLSLRAGQPRVIITDEAALPNGVCRFKREPDKVLIKEHLARGDIVPGATLSNSEQVLTVRIK